MSAVVRSLPIHWNDLPGNIKDRLSNDKLLLAQDAAAIEEAYQLDIYFGLVENKSKRLEIYNLSKTNIVEFRKVLFKQIKCATKEVKDNNAETALYSWFSESAVIVHRMIRVTQQSTLSKVREKLAKVLFSIKNEDVKGFFTNNSNVNVVNQELLTKHLLENNLNEETVQLILCKLNEISIDQDEVYRNSKQYHLNKAKIIGLGTFLELLTDEQVLLIVLVAYGVASVKIAVYPIGYYRLISYTMQIIYNVGYKEFKRYMLAEKIHELNQKPISKIIELMEKKNVRQFYIDEINRFFS